MPTVTCTEDSTQALLVSQTLHYDNGSFLEAGVLAECNSGTATYSGEAVQCGIDGCNPTISPGCGTPEPVSPGDSISLSETVGYTRESLAVSEFSDRTNGAGASCLAVEAYPEIPGPVETGMCPTVNLGEEAPAASGPPQNAYCGELGGVPEVTPVTFTGVTVDQKPLGFVKFRHLEIPVRYDFDNGTTLELKTGKILESGESFTMSYVPA